MAAEFTLSEVAAFRAVNAAEAQYDEMDSDVYDAANDTALAILGEAFLEKMATRAVQYLMAPSDFQVLADASDELVRLVMDQIRTDTW